VCSRPPSSLGVAHEKSLVAPVTDADFGWVETLKKRRPGGKHSVALDPQAPPNYLQFYGLPTNICNLMDKSVGQTKGASILTRP